MANVVTENTWVSKDPSVAKARVKLNKVEKLFDVVVMATLVVTITKTNGDIIVADIQKTCAPGDKVTFPAASISALIPSDITVTEQVKAVEVNACDTVTVSFTQAAAQEEAEQ